jgi:hypothetical protein
MARHGRHGRANYLAYSVSMSYMRMIQQYRSSPLIKPDRRLRFAGGIHVTLGASVTTVVTYRSQ